MKQYVEIGEVRQILKDAAINNFTVMDPAFQRYLDALHDVELMLDDLEPVDADCIIRGKWIPARPGPNNEKYFCSICGATVYYARHKEGGCPYKHCPCCKTTMEVDA